MVNRFIEAQVWNTVSRSRRVPSGDKSHHVQARPGGDQDHQVQGRPLKEPESTVRGQAQVSTRDSRSKSGESGVNSH